MREMQLMNHQRILKLIKCETSLVGWVKLNIGGARDNKRNASYRGIIRGNKGD